MAFLVRVVGPKSPERLYTDVVFPLYSNQQEVITVCADRFWGREILSPFKCGRGGGGVGAGGRGGVPGGPGERDLIGKGNCKRKLEMGALTRRRVKKAIKSQT